MWKIHRTRSCSTDRRRRRAVSKSSRAIGVSTRLDAMLLSRLSILETPPALGEARKVSFFQVTCKYTDVSHFPAVLPGLPTLRETFIISQPHQRLACVSRPLGLSPHTSREAISEVRRNSRSQHLEIPPYKAWKFWIHQPCAFRSQTYLTIFTELIITGM